MGSGTALADEPRLTLRLSDGTLANGRLPPGAPLTRVLLDARGRVARGPLLDTTLAPTLVFTTAASEGTAAAAAWETAGVEVCSVAEGAAGGVDLLAVLRELGTRGVLQLMVEGGGGVHGAFLSTPGAAQQLRLYVGATALGSVRTRRHQPSSGRMCLGATLSTCHLAGDATALRARFTLAQTSQRWIQSPLASTIGEAPRWKLLDVQRLGDDVCLDYALEMAKVDE